MNVSSTAVSFISTSSLFINAHNALAGAYCWKSLLHFLSDETEVAEFTGCSYDKMDVSGSKGRSHISLHNVHKPEPHPDPSKTLSIPGKSPPPSVFFLRLETLKRVQQRLRIVPQRTKAFFHASHRGPGRVQSIPLGIHLLRSARYCPVNTKLGDDGRNQFHIQHLSRISVFYKEYCLEIKSSSKKETFPLSIVY